MRKLAFFSYEEKRLYTKANQTVNLGVWGFDLNLVKWVTLPSVIGYKSAWQDIVLDNRRLRYEMKNIFGISYEDCLYGRLSGEGTLFLEGFYRLGKRMKAVDIQKVLSEEWGRIHHAPAVQVRDVKNFDDVKWDALHRVFRHSDSVDRFKMRVLHSPGWVRPGWQALRPVLMKWAFNFIGIQEDDPFITRDVEAEFNNLVWKQVTDYIRCWCLGEEIGLNIGNEIWYVKGTEIKVERVERRGRRAR